MVNMVLDPETIGLMLGAILSLMIFSYLLGDNVLYRWALAILVGCGAGYAMGMAARTILIDWIVRALREPELKVYHVTPLILGVLLLLKWFAPSRALGRIAVLGNISMGYLLGVGAAVAISGALLGTLIPQVASTGAGLAPGSGLLLGLVVLVGVITTLVVFSPLPRLRDGEVRPVLLWLQRAGRFFIVVALAVAFSGAITSGLTVWVERWWQLVKLVVSFAGGS